MITDVTVSTSLYAYVRADRRNEGQYLIDVYAPFSRTDVICSARLTCKVRHDAFDYAGDQDLVFDQARAELAGALGKLVEMITFGTEHPNWD